MWQVIILIVILLIYHYYFLSENINNNEGDTSRIKQLVRQISRWSLASLQDQNVFVANLHANYGVGYLQALKDIYREEEIKRATGIDLLKFSNEIVGIQDKAARKLIASCPNIGAKNEVLASLAGE